MGTEVGMQVATGGAAVRAAAKGAKWAAKWFRGGRGVVKAANALEKASYAQVKDKLTRYLLNEAHPDGHDKAVWFRKALGFTKDNMDDLADQIKFDPNTARKTTLSDFGQKYNQVISIVGSNGRTIDVTTAWIIGPDDIPKLITAVPTKK